MISRINRAARRQEGFTLIELLVVIGIIGILALLLLPQFRGMRDRARVASCQSNLKNISTQMEAQYVDNDSYPTLGGSGSNDWGTLTGATGSLAKLSRCPGDNSSFTYVPNYTSTWTVPASGVVTTWPTPEGTVTGTVKITRYLVYCTYHDGSSAIFPESVQLFVTQDGVVRRDKTGS